MLPPRPHRCIFCGKTGRRSREHIHPKWMRRHFPNTRPKTTHSVRHRDEAIKDGKLARPGDFFAQTLRVVCARCNNGWMSQLQTEAKPYLERLIEGDWENFDAIGRSIVARWAVMYAMVGEFDDPPTIGIPDHQRRFLQINRSVPAGWLIAVGKVDFGNAYAGNHNHFGARILPGTPPHTLIQFHSTGAVIGQMILQIVSVVPETGGIPSHFADYLRWHDLILISPIELPVRAPTKIHDWDSFYIVSNMFADALGFRTFSRMKPKDI